MFFTFNSKEYLFYAFYVFYVNFYIQLFFSNSNIKE